MNMSTNFNLLLRSLCVGILVVIVALLPAIFSSCKDNTGPETTSTTATSASISGTVVGKQASGSSLQLSGAVVSLHTIYGDQDTLTDSHGGFQFVVQFPDTAKASSATISASKLPDYALQTQSLIIRPGSDVVVPFTLIAKDTTILPSTSGPMANFVFVSQTSTYANVKGYTGIQTVSFTFEARDTANIPVDTSAAHRVKVYFKLQPAIGGGEKLSVDSFFTSNTSAKRGQVTVDLQVGTAAGIVQVQAWTTTKSGLTLSAMSLPLPIYSGPPSSDHFQMSADVVNFPGLNIKGLQDKINVQVGDKWSNPVKQGTPVVFSSSSGIIQPTATTDADGKATVTLTSGDPQPANGIAFIYAKTVGDSGKIVKDSISILVTGAVNILPLSDSLYITISGGDVIHVPYHVLDTFGHPLSAGTKVKVAVTGDAASRFTLSGDVDMTLTDTKDPAYTSFAFDLKDTVRTSSDDKTFSITITVTGSNGNLVRTYSGTAAGTSGSGGSTGAGPANKVASIVLSDVTDQQISVQGTGSKQASVLTFLILDHNGHFIPRDSATIHFSIYPTTLGATIFPDSAKTDAQGHVQAILNSGKTSGVVQIMAYADTGNGPRVFSSPVPVTIASGLPVISHYSLAVSRFNIPGMDIDGLADSLTAFVGDINGNPVQSNTAVYFKTDGGIVQPSSYTNAIGQASSILRSANPRTANGIVTVTASTIDTAGNSISRNALVIFSGPPIIHVATDTISLSTGIEKTLSWTVVDKNGNPLAMGNIISASLIGNNAGQVKMAGDVNTTLGDYAIGSGLTSFHVTLVDTLSYRVNESYLTLRISSSGPNGAVAPIDIPVKLMKSTNPSIALVKKIVVNADQNRIYVNGTGELQASHLAFNIQDANGNSLPIKGMPINVNLSGAVGSVDSSLTHTDSLGYAYATFSSGSDTGTAFILGQVGDVISAQRAITILPGKASGIYSSLYILRPPDTLQKINIPGAGINNAQKVGEVHAKVRDRYNNPVQPGTSVKLVTTAGQFATGADSITLSTDKNGNVSTDLFGGNPTPAGGLAKVTVTLSGENGGTVTKNLDYVYSGSPVITLITPLAASFTFKNLVDTSFVFSVRDANGNPLAGGSKITVSVTGAGGSMVKLTGDVSKTMDDTRDTNNTRFTIHIQDTNRVVTNDMNLGLMIEVDGPNGTKRTEIDGTLKAAPPSPFRLLTFKSMTYNPITVSGVGGQQTSQLVFEIQDSTGKAIQKSGIDVQFTLASLTASITPQHDTTDANGQVRVVVSSGTSAETLQVRAIANGIYSSFEQVLVQAGPPDQSFFSLQLVGLDGKKKTNFPGAFNAKDAIGFAQVLVKDIYGNIVKIGTAVKFNKNAGSMAAFGFTDKNGIAQATWLGGTPFPANGNAYVTAEALDKNNNVIAYDSLNVLYSGQAIIGSNLPANYTFHHGIDTTITYTVKDANNNPLSSGSTIQVTAVGDGASELLLTGDVNVTMSDTRDTNTTKFSFRVRDTNTVYTTTRPATLTIAVAGSNGTASLSNTATVVGAPLAVIAGLTPISVGNSTLNVRDAGGTETSLLTYELRDPLDHPIRRQGITVTFTSVGVPGSFSATTVTTDTGGHAITMFRSDSVAGVAQIIATVSSAGITSNSVKLLIVGGKPSQNFFTFILTRPQAGSSKVNFPGAMPMVQKIGEAQVQVGDRYGNPVPVGTPIYFKTNAGVIQGSAVTDANGFAQVDWFGGNPVPTGGQALITASTLGANGASVGLSDTVLYTGQATISGGPVNGFQIQGGGTAIYSFRVADANNNPLSAGNVIHATLSGTGAKSIIITGDTLITTSDTKNASASNYNVLLRDTSSFSLVVRDLSFTISASGVNGSAQTTATGTLLSTGGGRSKLPGSIALMSTSATSLQVVGTGGTETSTMIYELRDSVGVPVDSAYKVKFTLVPNLGGAFISPDSGYCDAKTGRINAVIHAGTVSGAVQATATVITPVGNIVSTPTRIIIYAGQPDEAHLSIGANPLNIPGLDMNSVTSTIGVLLGDKYSNPVPQGTAVYFSSTEGVITTNTGFTDATGHASATLYSGNPRAADGLGYVTAHTVGVNGADVRDSVRVMFSGTPIIDSIRVTPSNTTNFNVSFRVADRNHHPLAAGAFVKATVSGHPSIIISNIIPNDSIPDTQDPFWTHFSFDVTYDRSASPPVTGPFTLTIRVTSPNGNASYPIEADAQDQGNVIITILPTGVAGLKLSSITNPVISVKDAGGLDLTPVTFQLIDSVGMSVTRDSIMVLFHNLTGSSLGTLSIDSAITDNRGQASTIFRSSTLAGIAQITASLSGTNITSSPGKITIHGGYPDSTHTTLTMGRVDRDGAILSIFNHVNFPGGTADNSPVGLAQVRVGDKYNNPVPAGTPVYFTSNAGVIAGSGFTDSTGFTQVVWYGGSPYPAGGIAMVKASAIGLNSTVFSMTDTVTYSGVPVLNPGLPENFILPPGVDTTITFSALDENGNPTAGMFDDKNQLYANAFGINFSASGVTVTSGSTIIYMHDTRDPAAGKVKVRLSGALSPTATSVVLSVSYVGPNSTPISAAVNGTISASPSLAIAGLNLVSIATHNLTVKNTGGTESTLLTYQLRDSLGNALHTSGIGVAFSKVGVPGTFIPSTVLTDENGQAKTLFYSDTLAGIVNVSAHMISPVITSTQTQIIIVGGRPSQKFFTFNLTRASGKYVNFPGAASIGKVIGTAQVQAGDRYGNPVPSGTFIYFTTNAGIIQGSASTDANGYTSVNWYSGNPVPAGGIAKVVVSAIGETGTISDSAVVVYSGAPIASIVGLSNNFTFRHDIDTTITYTVKDANGNPIASGSTIQFSASGSGSSALELSGDVNVTTIDTQDTSKATFHVHIKDATSTPYVNRSLSLIVAVTGANGAVTQQVDGTLQGSVTSSTTAGISRLNLLSVGTTQLSVLNGGGTQSTLLSYELEDSLGNPVHQDSVQVLFTANGVQGTFTPSLTITDASGVVQTTFTSGTLAGVVEVVATVVGKGIASTQAHLVVVGGKPSQKHFTFVIGRTSTSGAKVNFPGAVPSIQTIGQVQVQVGDQYGNPVPTGTTVYFTTNAGVIQGSGATDANGFAKVDWFGGNPVPSNEVAILHASAISDTGLFTVVDTVLYTGSAMIASGPASGFQIPGAGVATFNYQITDQVGEPISEGSTITVSASGTGAAPLVLSGNINVTTPDTKSLAKTTYSFTAFDSSASSTTNRNVTFTINVSGPNGTVSQSFDGSLLAIGASHGVGDTTRSRLPGSIALISISNTDIQVTGTGGTETSTLVFEVRDSLGVPVDSSYQVKFTLVNPPGNAYISPISGRCDSTTGRINAVMHADSVAGVVQVYASVMSPTNTIKSSPVLITVHSGLPDQIHFSLYPVALNFAGLDLFAVTDTVGVQVGDKYSNPVAEGTAVYFNTHAGIIQPSGFTDANGHAKVIIYSGNPFPDASNPDPDSGLGFGKVFATTDGLNNVVVKDSILLLFSGTPIITYTDSTVFSILYGEEKSFNVTVQDRYNHPIAPGSEISIIATSSADLKVSDPIVVPDAQSAGSGTTKFKVAIATAPPDPNSTTRPQPASVKVYLRVTWMGRTYTVELATGMIS